MNEDIVTVQDAIMGPFMATSVSKLFSSRFGGCIKEPRWGFSTLSPLPPAHFSGDVAGEGRGENVLLLLILLLASGADPQQHGSTDTRCSSIPRCSSTPWCSSIPWCSSVPRPSPISPTAPPGQPAAEEPPAVGGSTLGVPLPPAQLICPSICPSVILLPILSQGPSSVPAPLQMARRRGASYKPSSVPTSAELGFGTSQVLLTPSGEESGLYSPNLSALPRRARGFCSL